MTRPHFLVLVLSLGLVTPAGALSPTPLERPNATLVQFWGPPVFGPPTYFEDDEDELVPPGVAARNVRAAGYRPIAPPRLVGQNWVIEAVNFDGMRVRVIVDGFSGRVIGARFVGAPTQPRIDDDLYPRRGSRIDPRSEDSRLAEPSAPRAEPRVARPPREERSARLAPLPTPRPAIDPPVGIPPAPPAETVPAIQPPAANLSPSGLSLHPISPTPPAHPPITLPSPPHAAPTPVAPPSAALPAVLPEPAPAKPAMPAIQPVAVPAPTPARLVEPPTAALPAGRDPSAPTPAVMPPPIEPAPVALPPPGARPVDPPILPITEAPTRAMPAPAETPKASAEEPPLIDGRRLAPNGESLPGPAPATPRVFR